MTRLQHITMTPWEMCTLLTTIIPLLIKISAVKRFIVINHIQNKRFCSTVHIYNVYINTNSIYLENIYMYNYINIIFIWKILLIYKHNIFFLNIYMHLCAFIYTYTKLECLNLIGWIVLRSAIIFRETHSERSSRQLSTALHDHITSPNDFCYFKGLTTAK